MRVVIAEDAVLLRSGLIRLLADEGIDAVAAVDNGDDLLGAGQRTSAGPGDRGRADAADIHR
jgi:DNA-binding NarL/FixJ family response regulator